MVAYWGDLMAVQSVAQMGGTTVVSRAAPLGRLVCSKVVRSAAKSAAVKAFLLAAMWVASKDEPRADPKAAQWGVPLAWWDERRVAGLAVHSELLMGEKMVASWVARMAGQWVASWVAEMADP